MLLRKCSGGVHDVRNICIDELAVRRPVRKGAGAVEERLCRLVGRPVERAVVEEEVVGKLRKEQGVRVAHLVIQEGRVTEVGAVVAKVDESRIIADRLFVANVSGSDVDALDNTPEDRFDSEGSDGLGRLEEMQGKHGIPAKIGEEPPSARRRLARIEQEAHLTLEDARIVRSKARDRRSICAVRLSRHARLGRVGEEDLLLERDERRLVRLHGKVNLANLAFRNDDADRRRCESPIVAGLHLKISRTILRFEAELVAVARAGVGTVGESDDGVV